MSPLNQEEKYLRVGIKAIQQYEKGNLQNGIDEVIDELYGKFHFIGTQDDFKSKIMELTSLSFGDKKQILNIISKNKYTKKALKFADSYVKENPEEISRVIYDIESEMGIRLADIGFDGAFYNNLLVSLNKNGLFGKKGALKLTADTVMNNFEGVTESFYNIFGNESIDGIKINDLGKFASSQLKITPTSMKKCYERNGFSGVLDYIIGSSINNGSQFLDPVLLKLKLAGIEHGLTSEKVVEIYNNNGILGRKGIVETAVKIVIEKMPGSERNLYEIVLSVSLENKKKKLTEELKSSLPLSFYSDKLDKQVQKLINEQINKFVSLSGVPKELKKENLVSVLEKNGLFEENGLFSYLSKNGESILTNASMIGLVEKKDINEFSNFATKLSEIKSYKDIFKINPVKSSHEIFAIGIARKAEELGIKPVEFLSDYQYAAQRKELVIASYGSIDKLYTKRYGSLPTLLPLVDKLLGLIQEADFDTNELKREVKTLRPGNKFLGEAFDALVLRYVNKTFVERATDYLRLTKGLLEQQIEYGKKELHKYNHINI